jgi:GNAT superfamily N-acetyltransferase
VHDHPVGAILRAAAAGRPPPVDGRVEVFDQPPGPVAAVLAFAGHHVLAAEVDSAWVHAQLPDWDLNAPLAAAFVGELGRRLGVLPDNLDLVLAGQATGAGPGPLEPMAGDHPRIERALQYRREVRAWTTPDGAGLLILGRGLCGRWEAAFEVEEAARGRGLGRVLVRAALDVVPAGEPVFMQVAPGNVPSVRAVLASGVFVPIGGELLFAVGERP